MAVQIRCINKDDDRITHIGWVNPNGNNWKLTQEEAIRDIKNWKYSFFVEVRWDRVKVIVSSRNGREYIKTENDWDEPNNLLSLPQCV